jgi:DNA-binding XRE family transcriptional regulator
MQAVRLNDEEVKAVRFWIEASKVHVETEDGREAAVPIAWYPRLAGASEHDILAFKVMGGGRLIHWPGLEEALGIETILHGIPGKQPSPRQIEPRAHRIKAMRLKARLTQIELAHRRGCSQALVSMAEKGRTWVGSDWEERVELACRTAGAPFPVKRTGKAKPPPRVPAGAARGKTLL